MELLTDMNNTIFSDKFFYHIYPLGMCNCPKHNDYSCAAGNKFEILTGLLDQIKDLGVNALYIGPVFESCAHGYDTVDYYHIDRRLGNNESFKAFCKECHKRDIAVVLDTVFNHTGREFFAFKDIIQKGKDSQFKDWYLNLDFSKRSYFGDCFDYDGWAGCKDLVKLNVDNQDVRNHLKGAVKFWVQEFNIDGLRLDAADVLSKDFLSDLGQYCSSLKDNFWLMGEVVHGDYNEWAQQGRIHSVTNYQIYKALWSSLNEKNMFELSYNLDREFGSNGIYNYSSLYNFVDNHDVNRIASTIKDQTQLHILYGMLFTIPGIPSIYYGSEDGILGARGKCDDYELRPALPPFVQEYPEFAKPKTDSQALRQSIKRFAKIRQETKALQKGDYSNVAITNTSLIYKRSFEEQSVIVAINADCSEQYLQLNGFSGSYYDILNNQSFNFTGNDKLLVNGNWMRILVN